MKFANIMQIADYDFDTRLESPEKNMAAATLQRAFQDVLAGTNGIGYIKSGMDDGKQSAIEWFGTTKGLYNCKFVCDALEIKHDYVLKALAGYGIILTKKVEENLVKDDELINKYANMFRNGETLYYIERAAHQELGDRSVALKYIKKAKQKADWSPLPQTLKRCGKKLDLMEMRLNKIKETIRDKKKKKVEVKVRPWGRQW